MATNIVDKDTIKSWFCRGLKPLEAHFHAWMDSFWHKNEQIPTASIDGLEVTLNSKAEGSDVTNIYNLINQHQADDHRHKTTREQGKLDRLADDPDGTYATKDELEVQGAIVVPMDFTLDTYDTTVQQAQDFVRPFVEDKTIYSKPIYLLYSWKQDYTTEGAAEYRHLVPKTRTQLTRVGEPLETITFEFNTSLAPIHKEDPILSFANECFTIVIRPQKNTVKIGETGYRDEAALPVISLYENSDAWIDGGDKADASYTWVDFANELKKGSHPAVLLRSPDSGLMCPASYHFTAGAASTLPGSIQISYLKETNGITELCVETRKFNNFTGSACLYDSPFVQKFPLGDSVRVSRIQVVDALPADSELQEGDIIILR